MSVLVIGATGFIGRPLVRSLRARGRDVVALSRRAAGAGDAGDAACDRSDIMAMTALVRARGIRTVVDLIGYTQHDTLPLIAALAGRIDKYLLISSIDVYRNYEGLHRKAGPTPVVGRLDEGSPLRESRHPYRLATPRAPGSPDAWLDAYDKIPLEQALRRSGQPHAILRLPMVCGPGDRQQRFAWAILPMLRGKDRLVVDPAWAAWRTTYGYVDDVTDAIATAASAGEAVRGTFNLGETDPPDHETWISRFAEILQWSGDIIFRPAPPDSPIAALNLDYPLIADTRRFRAATGWREPTPPEERWRQTISDQRARG